MHYCKGILESVSVFFATACDDHNVPVNLPACCKKEMAQHCAKEEGKKCCDDEVKVLKQDITSIPPSFLKWIDIVPNVEIHSNPRPIPVITSSPAFIERHASDSGPPVYIINGALIFYA